ncbi:MAG: hypothetical protein PVG83_00225, partial [Acidimicrobiia bacterium]
MEQKTLEFAAEAITAIGRLDVATARMSIGQAFAADRQLGALADAVYLACAEIEEESGVSTSTWNTLADAVASDELLAVIEST